MLTSIPPTGLGDILYHSLALRVICDRTDEEALLFCPKSCSEVPGIFDLRCVQNYSSLINVKSKLGLKNEIDFWKNLASQRGSTLFSILNDRFDHAFCLLFGMKLANGSLGNYYLNHPQGLRGRANTIFNRERPNVFNPQHFFHRLHYLICSSFFDISVNELKTEFRQLFLFYSRRDSDPEEQVLPLNKKTLFIFPDAGAEERNLSMAQLRQIINTFADEYDISVLSTRFGGANIDKRVTLRGFTSVQESFAHVADASIVVAADSFPGHFAALSGQTTFVIYNSPKIQRYCEFWGAPYENVRHIENGTIYRLDDTATAIRVEPCTEMIEKLRRISVS